MSFQKSILKLNLPLKKAFKLFMFCLFVFCFFYGCMVVRIDTHLTTKGTRIESEKESGPPPGISGLNIKSSNVAKKDGPPDDLPDHGDTQLGAGVELKVGPKLGEKTEILGVIGYDRYYYYVGNDDFVKVGMQGRRAFNNDSFWLGAEGSLVKDWAYIKDITENSDVGYSGYIFNPMTQQLEYRRTRTANGWMAGVLGGFKLKQVKSMDMSIFAGAYLIHLGDFTSKQEEVTKEGHINLRFKAGVEVALPFSK